MLDKASDALDTAQDIADNIKNLMEGNPMGAIGLVNDAGQIAELLLPESAATPIIAGGMFALTTMSLGFGLGDPDTGESFSDGAGLFQSAGDGLSGAYPNDWHGSASSAYSNRNAEQIGSAEQLLQADNLVVQILGAEAEQVASGREQMDNIATCLGAMIPVCLALEATVIGAPESLALQATSVAVAAAAAGMTISNMLSESSSNAAQLSQAASMYQSASHAPPLSTMPPPPGPNGTGDTSNGTNDGNPTGSPAGAPGGNG
ncbi:MAG: EspA/EspE family type VII secretion system effector, partial [Mycobacterium sp.]|nr:EspA/EspE family type VII secretion system effector [Mycobacterium sp.]